MYLFHVFCIELCLYNDIGKKFVAEVSTYLEEFVFKIDLTDQTRIRKWDFNFLYLWTWWQTLVYKTERGNNPNTVIFVIRNIRALDVSRSPARKITNDQIILKIKVIRDNMILVAGVITRPLEHFKPSGNFLHHLV
jgi:hypothetical protein